METREIKQIKIYQLVLNRMTAPKIEHSEIVAFSYDKQKLIDWYNSEKTESWQDDQWRKSFKKGSPLEWFNPSFESLEQNHYGQGITEDWVTQNQINYAINELRIKEIN